MIPIGVTVKHEHGILAVEGPKGVLSFKLRPEVEVMIEGNVLRVEEKMKTKKSSAIWGTTRAVIANLLQGVHQGFEKKLELQGLGYRAQVEGKILVLALGFSHPVKIEPPEGISFKVEKSMITVSGIDKVLVGNVAHHIRALKKPEPYKGKGIRYEGEVVRKKVGKKAVAATK